jgi:hypothetical protein
MAVRRLTSDEKQMISIALYMRRNYIETGSISLSAADLQNIGSKDSKRQFGAEIQALSEDQMRLILASKDLEKKMFNDQIFIDD